MTSAPCSPPPPDLDPLCPSCRGTGRVPGENDDPCPWCEGSGRASAAQVRARRLTNLATRIERLKGHRAEAVADVERLDAMILQVEGQRAMLLTEDG